jgi:hypothetical protein
MLYLTYPDALPVTYIPYAEPFTDFLGTIGRSLRIPLPPAGFGATTNGGPAGASSSTDLSELAAGYAKAENPSWTIREILDGDAMEYPPRGYGLSVDAAWVAYLDRHDGFHGLRSSTIIVIDKATLQLRYSGSAMDEG